VKGLLAAFPKLLGSDSKQHTYVETDSVRCVFFSVANSLFNDNPPRYLYQPMEELYLLLVTNKASNIIEDLDTLRLLSKGLIYIHFGSLCDVISSIPVVPDIAGTANNLTEEKVTDKCFELIFAFDEVSPYFSRWFYIIDDGNR
jgi:coatomer subunit delta